MSKTCAPCQPASKHLHVLDPQGACDDQRMWDSARSWRSESRRLPRQGCGRVHAISRQAGCAGPWAS